MAAVELPPRERTIPAMLERQAAIFGDKELFRCLGASWGFADAPGVAAHMAGALSEAGIEAGDRVAILSPNRPEVMRALLGCGWLGAVSVPVNVAVKTRQLRFYLENSGARLLVADAALLAALEPGALGGLPLERVWILDDVAVPDLGVPVVRFVADGAPLPARAARPGDAFAILYTSGTTGAPKGVICPHAQFYWWGVHASRFLEIGRDDVLATTLPLFHTNAINCFFQALLTGATQIVLPKFSASGFWRGMEECDATVGYLLGAMVPILLAQPPSEVERQHRIRVALGPGVPAAMHEALAARTGVRLVDGFGSTETNFVIGGTAAERVAGRMGRLAEGVRAVVADEDDSPVADGEPGELLLRADEPFAFATGYFGLPDKTAEAWRNLWFHTGDRVIRHPDGTFSFLDRLKDVIRRRGENISSFEVEQVVAALPEVETVAVYPVPSDLAEDEVMAALVLRPAARLSAEAVFEHCERELPRHAVPRFVVFVDELPRTENGKVRKFMLREVGVTSATVDRTRLMG